MRESRFEHRVFGKSSLKLTHILFSQILWKIWLTCLKNVQKPQIRVNFLHNWQTLRPFLGVKEWRYGKFDYPWSEAPVQELFKYQIRISLPLVLFEILTVEKVLLWPILGHFLAFFGIIDQLKTSEFTRNPVKRWVL